MPYIIVQNPSECLIKNNSHNLILDLDKNIYSKEINPVEWELAEKVINKPILDYKMLIENAKELHLIDSNVFCFATHLCLEKVKNKVIYLS
jgi:hypothetical protein